MSGFNVIENVEKNGEYFKAFYEKVYGIFDTRDIDYSMTFFKCLWPKDDDIAG